MIHSRSIARTLPAAVGITVGVIATASAVHLLAQTESPYWNQTDTVLAITSIKNLRIAAVFAEFYVAFQLLTKRSRSTFLLLGFYSASLIAYKTSFLLAGSKLPCSCLGILKAWFNFSESAESVFALALAIAWFSCALLLLYLTSPDMSSRAAPYTHRALQP
jgi:hypothetical protein